VIRPVADHNRRRPKPGSFKAARKCPNATMIVLLAKERPG
jgi:hypothetical protein